MSKISRRDFTKFGFGAAAIAAGAQVITSSQKDVNAFPSVIPPKEWAGSRRTGIRPNGTYWGGGNERIDVLSGNLNYSIPLFIAGGRGVNVRILCSYNSQLWERDNPKVLSYGKDTGYGYGWRIQLGSVVPQFSGRNISGYTYISDTGAEYPLSLSSGVWASLQGLYISYDPSKRKLQFPDGTFWVMGCESSPGEADAGALYPTLIQDRNGNQIIIRYMNGIDSNENNTSSRIFEIQDSRAIDIDIGRKTYSFSYDDGVVPHLLSITSHIDRKEGYNFTYEEQRVASPFGGNGNKDYDFVHVLKTVQQEGNPPQTFEYNQSGEFEQACLPYGARFRWGYETVNNQGKVRVVNRRGLILSLGQEEAIWEFSSKQNNGKNARRVTTLTEPQGIAKRIWSFDADQDSQGCGLLSILEEKDKNKTLRLTTYLWKYTVVGIPYVGTILTVLDPGTPDESATKEEFDRDLFGNLAENRKYDFGNPFQPMRVVRNTYLTDGAYIERGIYDLLLTSTIGDGKESVEQIRNQYDTTSLVDLQNLSEHDSGYGTRQTIRGNLTESVVGDVYSRIKFDITGVVDTFEDGIGSRITFSGDKQENGLKSKKMILDNNTILGFQTMMHMNFKPKIVMLPPTGEKSTFKNARQLQIEGRDSFTLVQTVNMFTKTTTDGVYKSYVYDDFQRICFVEEGSREGVESVINYEWGCVPNAPLGLCLRASLPHAPCAEPEWVTYEYDALGRLISKDTLSHGGIESFVHKGNLTTTVNARGGWKKLSVDTIGKIRKVTVGNPQEGLITETDYQYNHRGCLKTATLPRDEGTQKHTFTYDNGGRLVTGNRAESGHEEHAYNVDGTLASRTDAKGQRTAFFYDSQKRLTSIKRFDADGQIRYEQGITLYYDVNPFEAFYSQNPESRLTAAQWGDADSSPGLITEMYSYSQFGLMTAKRVRINRGGKTTDIDLTYSYNTEGRIAEISYTDGPVLTYTYDSMGRQSILKSGTDVLVKDASYSAAGHLVSFQQLVPGTDEYITEIRTINSRCQTNRIAAEQSGNPIVDIEYEYSREDGRLIADKDCLSGDRTAYDYDSMGRLKTAKSKDRDWEAGFEYDGFGNLTKKKQKNGRSFESKHNPKTNRAEMDQIEYDANGNIINHFGMKLSFDIENRLTEVRHIGKGTEKYAYNKDNLRMWKKYPDGTEEFYLYGADNRLLATYRLTESESGEISVSLTDNNIFFANRLMRTMEEAVVLDRIGNVKAGSGRRVNRRMGYAPFGEEDTKTGENRIKYGTYLRDGISGLDYAKRRYYSSELGRFISPDPYIGSIRLDNPDSWNRYAYVENDPINNIDPNGTYCIKDYAFWCDNWNCPAYTSFYDDYGGDFYFPLYWCAYYVYDPFNDPIINPPPGGGGGSGGGSGGSGGSGGGSTTNVDLSGLQSNFNTIWNNSFPNGIATEHGGTIVSDANGNLSVINIGTGPDPGNFSPNYNVGPGQTVQGVFHTHPYDNGDVGVSLSGGDAGALINNNDTGIQFVIAQSGTEQFMYMRTDSTPSSANSAQIHAAQDLRIAMLRGIMGMSLSEASKIAARETAETYNLEYYEGSNGVFQRVYP